MVTYKEILNGGQLMRGQHAFAGPVVNSAQNRKGTQLDASLACTPLCHRLARAGNINPYKREEGETIPQGYGRNFHGLLIRYLTQGPQVNLESVSAEADFLKDHTIIASFVGKKIPQHNLADWIQSINRRVGQNSVSFKVDMGRGFLFLTTANANVTRQVLSLTPHSTPWETCVYQEWIPNFDPDFPTGMKIPTWISLVKLPHEYKPFEGVIAASLGPVYSADPLNKQLRDPRFYIGLDVSFGWPSAIETQGLNAKVVVTLVNYEDTPVRCRFCLSLNHKVGDCVALKLNQGPKEVTGMPTIAKGRDLGSPLPQETEGRPGNLLTAILTPIHRPTSSQAPRNHSLPKTGQNHSGNAGFQQTSGQQSDTDFTIVQNKRKHSTTRRESCGPPHNHKTQARRSLGNQFALLQDIDMECTMREAIVESRINQISTRPASIPGLSTEQVVNQLALSTAATSQSDECMCWSPGKYGRNPSEKRAAYSEDTTSQKDPQANLKESDPRGNLSISKKRATRTSPALPNTADSTHTTCSVTPPPVIPRPESPEIVRVLYDKPPLEAFKIIEQVQHSSQSEESNQSNSLGLDQYSTQILESENHSASEASHRSPVGLNQLQLSSEPNGRELPNDSPRLLQSPWQTLRLGDCSLEDDSCSQKNQPSASSSKSRSKLKALQTAASFQALRSAAAKQMQSSKSTPTNFSNDLHSDGEFSTGTSNPPNSFPC
jgi:hypothetical protein